MNYFVSDIHIQKMESERGQNFLAFLKTLNASNCKALYMLGDIFDLWIGEHDYFLKQYTPIIQEINRLLGLGIEVSYFEGNHDLYLKSFWQDILGCKVYSDDHTQKIGNYKVRMEHGDKANPEDKGYMFLRWFLRSGPVDTSINNLPSEWVEFIGRKAAKASRSYTKQLKWDRKSVLHTYVKALAAQEDFDLIITGHLHIHDDFEFELNGQKRRSINLGSWYDSTAYLIIDDKSIEVREFTNA